MHQYQRPDTSLTLGQGLSQYYDVHENVTPPGELEGAAAELFRNHDVGHVIFGTSTDLVDEARTDTWLLYGCDVGFWGYTDYLRQPAAKALIKEIGFRRLMKESWAMTRAMFDARRRARRMYKKWPWADHADLLDRSLTGLREEFGICPTSTAAR